jgi:hypothetical protein
LTAPVPANSIAIGGELLTPGKAETDQTLSWFAYAAVRRSLDQFNDQHASIGLLRRRNAEAAMFKVGTDNECKQTDDL